MNRNLLYNSLKSLDFYLPPLSDKSLTLEKLQALARFEKMTFLNELIEEVDLPTKTSKENIRRAILRIYNEPLQLWFTTGRLPNKKYLINYLYALDENHPLLGKTFKNSKQRLFKVNEKCKRCVRQCESFHTSLRYKLLVAKKKVKRPLKAPQTNPALELYEKARVICKSRHGVIGLRRGMRERTLRTLGFDNMSLQGRVQEEIGYVDQLIDRLINLP